MSLPQRHEAQAFYNMSFGHVNDLVGEDGGEQVLVAFDNRKKSAVDEDVGGRQYKGVDGLSIDCEECG